MTYVLETSYSRAGYKTITYTIDFQIFARCTILRSYLLDDYKFD